MGIGENGHIAFNDPPVADFNDAQLVKIVELDQACRQQQVNDDCFATIDAVPTNAITLTIPALMAAKYIYCMVPGPTKAEAVFNTLNQDIIEQYPSTILRRHDEAILYLDAFSSGKV
jgi:glucosamine-6-phosphate deaminase